MLFTLVVPKTISATNGNAAGIMCRNALLVCVKNNAAADRAAQEQMLNTAIRRTREMLVFLSLRGKVLLMYAHWRRNWKAMATERYIRRLASSKDQPTLTFKAKCHYHGPKDEKGNGVSLARWQLVSNVFYFFYNPLHDSQRVQIKCAI